MDSKEGGEIPPEIMAELYEAARRAASGVRDPEAMRLACERMDRMSEEIRKKHGILNIGVPFIRQLRDGEYNLFELTEEQSAELSGPEPARALDPKTGATYVLVPAETYERLEAAFDDGDPEAMYPLIADIDPDDWEDGPALDQT